MLQGSRFLVLSVVLAMAWAVPPATQGSKPTSVSPGVSLSGALSSSPAQQLQVPAAMASSYRQAPGQQPYGINYAMSPYYASGHYAQQSPSILPSRFLALPARRRSSFTSKLRNFMNAIFFRQGSKPTYSTDAYSYDPSVASKPFYLSPTSYKPIPVPVRQLQKYYKPYAAAESSFIPTYVSPYASASQTSYGTAALAGNTGSSLSNGVYGSSSYQAYPVQSSYNIGGYQLPSGSSFSGSPFKRSSTGATTYTGPTQGGKVTFSKS